MTVAGAFRRCAAAWDAAERALLGGLAAAMVAMAALQIVLRVGFRSGLPWIEPLLGVGLLWLTMLGALAATGLHKHISMDLLSHVLPPRARPWITAAAFGFAAVLCGRLAWISFGFVQLQMEMDDAVILGAPVWMYALVLPVVFAMMSLRFALHAGMAAAGSRSGRTPDAAAGPVP